ncbi:MAG: c-type cytochrome [Candidatus Acidiferrales bacterium]
MRKPIAIALLILGGSALIAAQNQNNNQPDPGRAVYESHCAACHGLDAHGGEAPNITTPDVQAQSDAQLTAVIHDGHTGGMPGFASMLSDSDIAAVVSFLRDLQHRGATATVVQGNVANGKTLFFGSAGCSQCHMIKGEGGFLGADLSGVPLSADDIRTAIVTPPDSPTDVLTTVTLKNGRKYAGLVRNEDNFSLQLIEKSGALLSIDKASAAKIERATTPFMPADYGTRLTSSDLQDLVAYVASQTHPATGRGRGRRQ